MGEDKIKKKIGCSTLFIVILTLFFITLFGGFFYLANESSKVSDAMASKIIYSNTVRFEKLGSMVYLKVKEWGLLGNHSCLFLSDQDKDFPDQDSDVIFDYYGRVLYKKIEPDSLIIYMPSLSYTEEENYNKTIGNIKLQIFMLKNSTINDYYKNYERMGLSHVKCE